MATGQSKRKLKIAFIHLPINEIRPPISLTGLANSVELIGDEIARRLTQSCQVSAYYALAEQASG
jgi:hypothetical protein